MAGTEKRSRVKMLGKVVGGFMGSRIAERAGQSGALGATAGILASRVIRRSPIGALVIGGAWLGHKLYKRNQERKFEAAAQNAKPAKIASPDMPAGSSEGVTASSKN